MSTTERLRALLAEGTPGPWHDVSHGWPERGIPILAENGTDIGVTMAHDFGRRKDDADLIAAAVNAPPELLDEVEHRREAMRIETWCAVCESTRCKFDPPDPDAAP